MVRLIGKRQCLIYLSGRLMRVSTTFEPLLRSLLHYMTFMYQHRGRRKSDFYCEAVPCYDVVQVNGVRHVKAAAGFYEAVIQMAYDFGAEVTVIDQDRNATIADPLTVPVLPLRIPIAEWEKSRSWQQTAIRYMNSYADGRFKIATGGGKSHLIKMIARWLPNSRILVVDRSQARLTAMAEKIMEVTSTVGLYHSKQRCDPTTARVLVCSVGCLDIAREYKWDVFIADEIHELVTPSGVEKLPYVRAKRAYAFGANVEDRVDNADKWAEAYFGPIRMRREYADVLADGDVVPIYVDWISWNGPAPVRAKQLPGVYEPPEKASIWRNIPRNRAFAARSQQYFDEGRQVLVLTTSTEHALALGQLLGWPVIARTPTPARREYLMKQGLLQADQLADDKYNLDMQHLFADRKVMGVIANRIWHTGLDFQSLDVLVRTDGSGSEIMDTQLPGRLARRYPGKRFGVLVDSKDSQDSAGSSRADRRADSYLMKGWKNASAAEIAAWRD